MKRIIYSCFFFVLFLIWNCHSLPATVIWSLPEDLSTAAGTALRPEVQINNKGKGVAVWLESVGISQFLRASIFDGFWSDPITLNPPSPPNTIVITESFQVAINEEGEAIVVWAEVPDPDPTPINIRAATFIDNLWKVTEDIAVIPPTSEALPQVAIDSKGNAIAIWQAIQSPKEIIQVAALPHHQETWSTPLTISDDETVVTNPEIGVGKKGNFVAVWNGDQVIRARALTFKSVLEKTLCSLIRDISIPDPNVLVFSPALSTNNEGQAAVVWSQEISSQENSSIETRMFRFEKGKIKRLSEIVTLAEATTINGLPDVAINHRGDAVAAWQSTIDSSGIVVASIFRKGRWGPAQIISSELTLAPIVAIDGRGNAVAIWTGEDITVPGLPATFANTFQKGKWDTPLQLSAPDNPALSAHVATNRRGKTIAAWNRSLGITMDIIQASLTNLRE